MKRGLTLFSVEIKNTISVSVRIRRGAKEAVQLPTARRFRKHQWRNLTKGWFTRCCKVKVTNHWETSQIRSSPQVGVKTIKL